MLNEGNLNRFLRAYDAGQVIFSEGEPGDFMYIVQEGGVEIYKERERKGENALLTTLLTGDIFGEMALIDRSPRSATARAGNEGAKVLVVDSGHFIYLVSQQPAFALVMLEVMASRLRTHNNQRSEI